VTSPSSPQATALDPAPAKPEVCACCDGELRAARRLAVLGELAEIGLALARSLGRQVADAAAAEPAGRPRPSGGDPALAFSRIARAVRLTLALEARFDQDGQAAEAERAARRADDERARLDRRIGGLILKDEARAIARAAIEAEAGERGGEIDVERLLADLDERLEDEADWDCDRPIGEMVARICRDLGVAFDADAWVDEDEAGEDDADEDDAEDVEAAFAVTLDRGGVGSLAGAAADVWPP
jgi:hypothetical protein